MTSTSPELIDALEQALTEGNITDAQRHLRELNRHPDRESCESAIAPLQARLRELEDWQQYATNPKREALCEQMEALVHVDLEPDDKAKQIKSLQTAWRELGASNSAPAQQLWHRFRRAGEKAYKPCADYFESRQKERRDNLRIREQVCDALEALLSSTESGIDDWKAFDHQVRHQQREWRNHADIPHASRKALTKRFKQSMTPIERLIRQEQERNHTVKSELITSLQQQMEQSTDRAELIQTTLQLQKDWKTVGICDRRTDQKLWRRFRELCDQVFEEPEKAPAGAGGPTQSPMGLNEIRQLVCLCEKAERGEVAAWPEEARLLPKQIVAPLRERYDQACSGETRRADVDTLERLCLEAEMLAQVESPGYAREQRMALQIERLEQGLNQRQHDNRSQQEKLTDLEIQWLLAGADPCAHLATRFRAAINHAGESTTPQLRHETSP